MLVHKANNENKTEGQYLFSDPNGELYIRSVIYRIIPYLGIKLIFFVSALPILWEGLINVGVS